MISSDNQRMCWNLFDGSASALVSSDQDLAKLIDVIFLVIVLSKKCSHTLFPSGLRALKLEYKSELAACNLASSLTRVLDIFILALLLKSLVTPSMIYLIGFLAMNKASVFDVAIALLIVLNIWSTPYLIPNLGSSVISLIALFV